MNNFNGFIVEFWNHETRFMEANFYNTIDDVMSKGFEEFPTVEDFIDDLYEIYGDMVGRVTDNNGTVIYDNYNEMKRQIKDFYG